MEGEEKTTKKRKKSKEKERPGSSATTMAQVQGCETKQDKEALESSAMEVPPKSKDQMFYDKLIELYKPSGLSLLFNFRKTHFDLYQFYTEVTARGGFNQVTADRKWNDIACALKLNSNGSIMPLQLQNIYARILYGFELVQFYRTQLSDGNSSDSGESDSFSQLPDYSITEDDGGFTVKWNGGQIYCQFTGESSTMKQKSSDSSCELSSDNFTAGDGSMRKKKCMCQAEGLKPPILAVINTNETKKDVRKPTRPKTAYQIFLRKECIKLKQLFGEKSGRNMRMIATNAWKWLPEHERTPYFEESRKDKKRYIQEMAAYNWSTKDTVPVNKANHCSSKENATQAQEPSETGSDFHVTLQPNNANHFLAADKSTAERAAHELKNAQSNTPVF